MKLTKKEIKAIEELGWSIKETDYGYFLENWSPAGGDMVIEVPDKEGIINYCENYDAEDEFNVWWGVDKGEPSTPSALWQDCLDKDEMFKQLKELLIK